MKDRGSGFHEALEPVRLCSDRESAERLAARLRKRGWTAEIEPPGEGFRHLAPGTWLVSVPASSAAAAAREIEGPEGSG